MKRLLAVIATTGLLVGCSGKGGAGDKPDGFVAKNKADANAQCEQWQQSPATLKRVKAGEDVPDRTYVDEDGQPLVICAR